MSFIIWLPLVIALLVLISVSASLGRKASRLNRQARHLRKLKPSFTIEPLVKGGTKITSEIPDLVAAQRSRRNYLSQRAKRREQKQRSLVARLKS